MTWKVHWRFLAERYFTKSRRKSLSSEGVSEVRVASGCITGRVRRDAAVYAVTVRCPVADRRQRKRIREASALTDLTRCSLLPYWLHAECSCRDPERICRHAAALWLAFVESEPDDQTLLCLLGCVEPPAEAAPPDFWRARPLPVDFDESMAQERVDVVARLGPPPWAPDGEALRPLWTTIGDSARDWLETAEYDRVHAEEAARQKRERIGAARREAEKAAKQRERVEAARREAREAARRVAVEAARQREQMEAADREAEEASKRKPQRTAKRKIDEAPPLRPTAAPKGPTLSRAQKKALRLARDMPLSEIVYCMGTDVDIPTARRELRWLCESGLLRKRGRGEATRYDLVEQAR